jgi:hypothetical protein
MGNVDGGLVGDILGHRKEGTDRTGQRAPTYELAEALLRHLAAEGKRGEVRISVSMCESAWAKYRSEVARPMRARPSVVVVPVAGVGVMEFRRRGRGASAVSRLEAE